MKDRKRQIIKLSFMVGLTFTFFLTEVICGHVTGSLALIGDSYHMISDVVALVIGLSCVIIATKPSKRNTYGWARAEILGALFNTIFLGSLCFTIFIEAVERLFHPHEIHEPNVLLIVGCIGLAVNLFGIVLFCNETHGHSHGSVHGHGHCHGHEGSPGLPAVEIGVSGGPAVQAEAAVNGSYAISESADGKQSQEVGNGLDCMMLKRQSVDLPVRDEKTSLYNDSNNNSNKKKKSSSAGQMNIRGVFLHVIGDALGSVVVIVSALVVKFCEGDWTLRVDPILSLIMITIILSTTFPLMKQSSLILLQHPPTHIDPSELTDRLSTQIPDILGVHELHVWQLAGSRNVASVHVKCSDRTSYEEIARRMRGLLHEEGIHSSTIQPEFVRDSGEVLHASKCSMECRLDGSCSEGRCCSDAKVEVELP